MKSLAIHEQSTTVHGDLTYSTLCKQMALLILYFAVNLALTMHIKWLLSQVKFEYPWFLSALHVATSGLGSVLLLKSTGKAVEVKKFLFASIGLFSVVYSANIALSNVSLKYVSLALHQVVRSGTPIVTLLLEWMILGKTHNLLLSSTLIPIMGGIALTIIGEAKGGLEPSVIGIMLTILGVFISSLKGVLTNFIITKRAAGTSENNLQSLSENGISPLELVLFVSPWATAQCLLFSIVFREERDMNVQLSKGAFDSPSLILGLLVNGLLAFGVNWIGFTVNKETSALTMTVAGNVKQAASILFSVLVFHTPLDLWSSSGIVITLVGGLLYSLASCYQRSKPASDLKHLPM